MNKESSKDSKKRRVQMVALVVLACVVILTLAFLLVRCLGSSDTGTGGGGSGGGSRGGIKIHVNSYLINTLTKYLLCETQSKRG